jgi:hypothetical protein
MNARVGAAILLLASAGCDKPPDGLLDALQHAMMGLLMSCPGEPCDNVDQVNIDIADTAADLQTKFSALTAPWCPSWTLAPDRIDRGDEGKAHDGATLRVNLAVFGQVRIKAEDVDGKVVARSDGWLLEVTHDNHGRVVPESGRASCPQRWPVRQCRYQPGFEYASSGEVSLSWIDAQGAHSASADAGDVLTFEPGQPLGFCQDADHAEPLACGEGEGEDG